MLQSKAGIKPGPAVKFEGKRIVGVLGLNRH